MKTKMMKTIDTVLFDMDGVIADTEPLKFEAYRSLYKKLFGADIQEGQWRIGLKEEGVVRGYLERSFDKVKKNLIKGFSDKNPNRLKELFDNAEDQKKILSEIEKGKIPELMIPILGKAKRDEYAELLKTKLNPILGSLEFVKYVADKGYLLAVATGSTSSEADTILTKFGIKKYFKAIVTKDDVAPGRGKPLPDIYLACLKKLGQKPGNCLVIEDAVLGVQSAIAANLRVIAITTSTPRKELVDAGAEYVADSFKELKEYVSKQ